jgi:hypothetical protein
MSFNGFAAGSLIVLATVAACGVESVLAKDYDQSCTKDADCVLVAELKADGTSCTLTCPRTAINENDQETYETELEEERRACTDIAEPDCVPFTAICTAGKCASRSAMDGFDAGATD